MNLSTPIGCTESQLLQAIAKRLKISKTDIIHIQPIKKSIDARKKPNIFVVWTFLLKLKQEEVIYKRYKNDHDVERYKPHFYNIPKLSLKEFGSRPVVIGFGPAEMFAAYLLAKVGLRPIVLERGKCVEQRQKDVAFFWKTGQLNPSSNVQFGEGGAGTFSDGKLTTGIKDFRIQFILETFISCGAPKEILYLAKPHIGTDRLVQVVKTMREKIQAFRRIRIGDELRLSIPVRIASGESNPCIFRAIAGIPRHNVSTTKFGKYDSGAAIVTPGR